VEVRGGHPPLEVWTVGKECGRRRARAPWPLAAGGSTDVDAPRPQEGGEQARGTSRSKTLAPPAGGSKTQATVEMGRARAGRGTGVGRGLGVPRGGAGVGTGPGGGIGGAPGKKWAA